MNKERNNAKNFSFKMDVKANPDMTNLSSPKIILPNKNKKHTTDTKLKEINNNESFSSKDSYRESNNDIKDKKKKSNETMNYVRFYTSDVNTRLASKVNHLNTINNKEVISNTSQDEALYTKNNIKRKKLHNVFETPSNNHIISYYLKNKAHTTKDLISKPKLLNNLIGKYETKFKAKKVAYTRGSKLSNSNLINIMRGNNTKKFKEQKEDNRYERNRFFTEKNVKYIDYISRSLNNKYKEFKDNGDNKVNSSNSNDNLNAIVNNFINKLSVMTPKSNNMSLLKQLELVDQGTHNLLHKDIVNNFITSYSSNTNKLKELDYKIKNDNNGRYKNDNEYYLNKTNNFDKLNTSENMISPAQNYIQKTKIKIFSSKKEAMWKLKPKHSNNKNLKSSLQKNKKTKTNKTYTTITKNINKLDKNFSKAYFSIVKKTNEVKNENFLGKKNNDKIYTKNLMFSNNSKNGNINLASKYPNNTQDSKYKVKYTKRVSNNNNFNNKEQINLTSIMNMFSNSNNSYYKINNTLNTHSNTVTTNNIDHANTCSHFFRDSINKINQIYINDDNYSYNNNNNSINIYSDNRFSTTYNKITSNQKQVGDKLKLREIQRKKIQVNKDLSKVSQKIIKQNSLNSKAFKPLFKNYSKHACLSTSNYFNNSNNSFTQKSVSMNFNSPYNISKNESLNNTFNYNNSTSKQANNNLTNTHIHSQSYIGNFLIKNHSLNLNSNTYNTISNANCFNGNININSFKNPTSNSNSMNNIKDNINHKRSSFIDSVNIASNNDSELLL